MELASESEAAIKKGKLTVVGTGIKLGEQITQEALYSISKADIVYAVVADAATLHWLERLNKNTHTLTHFYDKDKHRINTYNDMSDTIVNSVIEGKDTCAVFYGHPGIFVYPSHSAVKKLKELGYEATMQPGVSADACLFADIGIDPAKDGCQSYEATDFLLFKRKIDPTVACVMWQVGVVGEFKAQGTESSDFRFQILIDELEKYYPSSHRVTLYESTQFNIFESKIETMALEELRKSEVSRLSTLFIPPSEEKCIDKEMVSKLNINLDEL